MDSLGNRCLLKSTYSLCDKWLLKLADSSSDKGILITCSWSNDSWLVVVITSSDSFNVSGMNSLCTLSSVYMSKPISLFSFVFINPPLSLNFLMYMTYNDWIKWLIKMNHKDQSSNDTNFHLMCPHKDWCFENNLSILKMLMLAPKILTAHSI